MKEYVFDANALLRYFNVVSASGGDKVRQLFLQAQRGEARLFICVVNLGEIFYILLRHVGEARALQYLHGIQHSVAVVEADWPLAEKAATLKNRHKLGYADGFAAGLALQKRATLVSSDPAFEGVGRALKWLRLPKFEKASP